MTNKTLAIGVLVAIVLAIGGYSFPQEKGVFGDVSTTCANGPVTCFTGLYASSQFQLSSTGTTLNRINAGTCFIQPYATTIAATSTATVDCQATAAVGTTNTGKDVPLTGVSPGDTVVANLSSTTIGNAYMGLDIIQNVASSTAGYLTFVLANNTGATFTWPTNSTASGTASYVVTH